MPAAVLCAGLLLGATWLVVAALVIWLALCAATFFEKRPATAAPERTAFARPIAARLRAAEAARVSIRAAVEGSTTPLEDVTAEVDALVGAMEGDAVRAQRIHEFLAQESPAELEQRIAREPSEAVRTALGAKLDAVTRLLQRLDALLAELDHVVVTLQTVQAEILATDGLDERLLAGRVSELRENVQLRSAGLEEAFAETRSLH